jgi:hypothetical protein
MSTTAEAVLALEQRRLAAMLSHDVDALDALLSESLVYVHSSGLRDDKASYLSHLREGRLGYVKLGFTALQGHPLAQAALVTGCMEGLVRVLGREQLVRTLFLTVWAFESDGRWRLQAHQGTPLPA